MHAGRVGLLKLNIEGAEYDVLTVFHGWDRLDAIVVEWHGEYLSLQALQEVSSTLREHSRRRGRAGCLETRRLRDHGGQALAGPESVVSATAGRLTATLRQAPATVPAFAALVLFVVLGH